MDAEWVECVQQLTEHTGPALAAGTHRRLWRACIYSLVHSSRTALLQVDRSVREPVCAEELAMQTALCRGTATIINVLIHILACLPDSPRKGALLALLSKSFGTPGALQLAASVEDKPTLLCENVVEPVSSLCIMLGDLLRYSVQTSMQRAIAAQKHVTRDFSRALEMFRDGALAWDPLCGQACSQIGSLFASAPGEALEQNIPSNAALYWFLRACATNLARPFPTARNNAAMLCRMKCAHDVRWAMIERAITAGQPPDRQALASWMQGMSFKDASLLALALAAIDTDGRLRNVALIALQDSQNSTKSTDVYTALSIASLCNDLEVVRHLDTNTAAVAAKVQEWLCDHRHALFAARVVSHFEASSNCS